MSTNGHGPDFTIEVILGQHKDTGEHRGLVSFKDQTDGPYAPVDARRIASHLVKAAAEAEMLEGMYRFLTGDVGLDADAALGFVAGFLVDREDR